MLHNDDQEKIVSHNERKDFLLVYYSGSGSTKAISEVFKRKLSRLGFKFEMIDLNIHTKPQVIDDFDYIVFGTPTYHCSPPKTVTEFIDKLSYQNTLKKIFIFATYGLYPGNNIRTIAKKLLSKNIICVGSAGFKGPAADSTMMLPQWIGLMYRYERRIKPKLETAVKQIEETFLSKDIEQKIPVFKWYVPLDYIPNQIFARRKFNNVYRNQLELITDRWDGSMIQCPRNCWTVSKGQVAYDPSNCEFCLRCIHRTANKAVVFSDKMKDRPRLDPEFYAKILTNTVY